ncbi:MAG: glycosyltransferase family 2 protein [Sedimentisphaerales bacterium]|nr:glycosyltransferase family 2 protein [Sedimentisphaerales bacterium]
MDVSVIITNYNTRQLLIQCLESVYSSTNDLEIQVIVVDNASSDDSVEYVLKNFPKVRLIENNKNMGFAAANNQGIEIASGRFILFLNSDTIVHEGAISAMVEELSKTEKTGACGCRLLNKDGSLQQSVKSFPTFGAMMHRHTIAKFLGVFGHTRRRYKMPHFAYDEISSIDQVIGAVLMIKADLLKKIGVMDENLTFYFEETDLCYRIKQAGYEVYFVPTGKITHLGGGSSTFEGAHKFRALYFKSLLYYFRKHKGRMKTALFSLIFKPGVFLYMICEIPKEAILYLIDVIASVNTNKKQRRITHIKEYTAFLWQSGWDFLIKY